MKAPRRCRRILADPGPVHHGTKSGGRRAKSRAGPPLLGKRRNFRYSLRARRERMGVVAMSMPSPPQRSWPIGLLLLLAVAGVLYGLMLGNAMYQPSGGGESGIAAAIEALYLTAGLWIVLVIMTIVGGVMGTMPGWAGALAGILVPASGIANFTAVDMCSRHMPWAIVFPIEPALSNLN